MYFRKMALAGVMSLWACDSARPVATPGQAPSPSSSGLDASSNDATVVDAGHIDAGGRPDAGIENVTFGEVHSRIIVAHCVACHRAVAHFPLALDDLNQAYANMVGVVTASSDCAGDTLVAPGDPWGSLFYLKVVPGTEICGRHMPQGLADPPPLSPEDQRLIHDWIAGGARP